MTAQQQALLNDAARILTRLLTRGEAETWRDAHDWITAYNDVKAKEAERQQALIKKRKTV